MKKKKQHFFAVSPNFFIFGLHALGLRAQPSGVWREQTQPVTELSVCHGQQLVNKSLKYLSKTDDALKETQRKNMNPSIEPFSIAGGYVQHNK